MEPIDDYLYRLANTERTLRADISTTLSTKDPNRYPLATITGLPPQAWANRTLSDFAEPDVAASITAAWERLYGPGSDDYSVIQFVARPNDPVPVPYIVGQETHALDHLPQDLRQYIWDTVRAKDPISAGLFAHGSVLTRGLTPALYVRKRSLLIELVTDVALWLIHRNHRVLGWEETMDPGAPRDRVPRRDWNVEPSLFFPPGVGRKWLQDMTEFGLLWHKESFGIGLPDDVAQKTLPEKMFTRFVAPLFGLELRRTAVACGATVGLPTHEYKPSRTDAMAAEALSTTWLVHRVLNGMAPAPLVDVGGGEAEARYSFRTLPFAPDGTRSRDYRLPDVAIRLRPVAGQPMPDVVSITLAYRNASGNYDPQTVVLPPQPWAAGPAADRFYRAARIAACAMFLSGQFDQHIVRGHLLPEMIAVAMDAAKLDPNHPIRLVLAPRLAQVDAVNHAADGAIWGDHGVFAMCSPLTTRAISQRMRERLGGIDWKRYAPPSKSWSPGHYAPRVFDALWQTIQGYATDAMTKKIPGKPAFSDWYGKNATWTAQVHALFAQLQANAAPFAPWDNTVDWDRAPKPWLDGAEFAPSAGTTAVPPATGDRVFSGLDTTSDLTVKADIVQLITFTIYQAVVAHSWANVRQLEDAGDPKHALICLATTLDDGKPAASWAARAAPSVCDLAFQKAVAATLTTVPVDTLADELKPPVSPGMPVDPMEGPDSLAARIAATLAAHQGADHPLHPDVMATRLEFYLSRPDR